MLHLGWRIATYLPLSLKLPFLNGSPLMDGGLSHTDPDLALHFHYGSTSHPCQMHGVPGQLSSLSSFLSISVTYFFYPLSPSPPLSFSLILSLALTSTYLGPLGDTNACSSHINVMYYRSQEKAVFFCLWIYHVCSQCVPARLFFLFAPAFFSQILSICVFLFSKRLKRDDCAGESFLSWKEEKKAAIWPAMWAHRPCHVKSNRSKKAHSWHLWWQFHYRFLTPFAASRQIDFHHKVLTWANLSADRAERKDDRMGPWVDQTDGDYVWC